MNELKLDSLLVDSQTLKRLEKSHDEALASGAQMFKFDGIMCMTTYAKYLIEFLKSELRNGCVVDDGDYDPNDEEDDDDESSVDID